jgi:hypothetical protein
MNAPPKPADDKDPRAERLAAALRENLKRRKAQARSKAQVREQAESTKGDSG